MSKKPREMIIDAATRALSAMAALASTDIKVDFNRAIVTGPKGVEKLDPKGFRVDVRLLERPEHWLGLVVPKNFLTAVGAGIMMMPTVPDEVTEEVNLAFDEAVNVGIGAWNAGLEDNGSHLDNGVDARRSTAVIDAVAGDPQWTQVWRLPVRFNNKEYLIALTGDGWLPVDVPAPMLVPAPVETNAQARPRPTGQPSTPPPVDAGPHTRFATAARLEETPPPAPLPQPRRPTALPEPGGRGGGPVEALVMLIDESGALRRWLAEQLKNPAYAFSSQESDGAPAGRTIVLVDERGLDTVALKAHKKIVMRLA